MPREIGGVEDAREVMVWICGGDHGLSSEAIAARMMGAWRVPKRRARALAEPPRWYLGEWPAVNAPSDVADLGRCLRLLERFPHWKPRFRQRMKGVSPRWARLVARWGDLERTLAEEGGPWGSGTAPRTYALLKQVLGERA